MGGLFREGAVGLGDDDEVGDLDHAPLDALQFVAAAGLDEQHDEIRHVGDGDLRLADPDGLDQHHVEARRFAGDHRVPRAPGDAAQGSARRRGADEAPLIPREAGHAGLVAEDRAARARTRRIDREHRDAVAAFDQAPAERLDERRFAHAGRAGDADANGLPRMREQGIEQALGRGAVVVAGRFEQRNRRRERPPVAGENVAGPRNPRTPTLRHGARCYHTALPARCARAEGEGVTGAALIKRLVKRPN